MPALATLTPAQIANMRTVTQGALADTVTVLRRERVPDGGGGNTFNWEPIQTAVPARIGLASYGGGGETDVRAASRSRLVDEEAHVIYLPAETDVEETDRLLDEANGSLYEVQDVLKRGAWELTRRCRCVEHDG